MNRAWILACTLLFAANARADKAASTLTPQQVDEIVVHLEESLNDYVFPETGAALKKDLESHRGEYRATSDSKAQAARLTSDLRSVGHDKHLEVMVGDEMGFEKEPTPEELRHAHEVDAVH